ncbi:heavy metal translocating P-type ATPase [Acidaminobacterium chupaoyuni]
MLENLGCANCAAKMEAKIRQLPGVESAALTYTTKQLKVQAADAPSLLPQIQQICASIEDQVKVTLKTAAKGETTQVYLLENLGCANCAAKMERKINELPEVSGATLTFATKQLKVTAVSQEKLLPKLQEICASIEPQVVVKQQTAQKQDPKEEQKKEKNELLLILGGAALFLLGIFLEKGNQMAWATAAFLCSYAVLGGEILWTAVKNLTKGHVFDENFLMSLATVGAIVIGEYAEAVGVMLFYRVGEYFEHRAVEKSRKQIMDAVDMRPEVVELAEGRVIPASEANPGDLLIVKAGDRIPLDSVVVEGESRIDTSPVTGEPVPVRAAAGDAVISGCMNLSGVLKVRVEKSLEESMVTRILDSVENAAASKPKIDRFITKFARIYTPAVVAVALITAIVPSLFTGNWHHWVYTALTFLVISCPCALVLSVPLSFFAGIGAGSKKGILFKGGVSLEAMKKVKAVVMDKTGTITKGNFEVQKIVSLADISADELLKDAAACESRSNHPIAVSIQTAAKKQGIALETPDSLTETAGQGVIAQWGGATWLCGNKKLMESNDVKLDKLTDEIYGSEVLLAKDGLLMGYLVIADTIKEEAKTAVEQLHRGNVVTAMLTGDAPQSAEAVARAVGVDDVFARLLPEEKVERLKEIRQKYGAVMFVGDGINDAPVLAGADVGAAMGSGADAAIEAADIVFMTSSMEAIPDSLAIARQTGAIAMQNVVFALAVKLLVMVLGLAGYANMWMAVFADSGVAMLCVINSIRILYSHREKKAK